MALRSLSSLLLLALARRPDVGQYIGLMSGVRILNGEVDRFNDAREVLLVGGVGRRSRYRFSRRSRTPR